MWLLNAETRRLEEFNSESDVPGGYAILSHTWGDDEVRFHEIESPEVSRKKSFRKIDFTCCEALKQGLRYVWVDTCCIDKKSSAELSEAINSMWRWYAGATVCYAYLSDVWLCNGVESETKIHITSRTTEYSDGSKTKSLDTLEWTDKSRATAYKVNKSTGPQAESTGQSEARNPGIVVTTVDQSLITIKAGPTLKGPPSYERPVQSSSRTDRLREPAEWSSDTHRAFRASRWFTRGWTLQELIAPRVVRFFDEQWAYLGEKNVLVRKISDITGIDASILESRRRLRSVSVAKRMSWAALRSTSRAEDKAYSLLGIFEINMPLLYGEGEKAFLRLQEEIIRQSAVPDHSILAWQPWDELYNPNTLRRPGVSRERRYKTLFSPSPYGFRNSTNIISWAMPQSGAFELLHRGLRISVYVLEYRSGLSQDNTLFQAALNCAYENQPMTHIALTFKARPRVDVFRTGKPVTREEEDLLYDRCHDREDEFPTLKLGSIVVNLLEQRTLTLAKQRVKWRKSASKVHLSVDPTFGAVVCSHPSHSWKEDLCILYLTPILTPRRSRSVYGSVVVRATAPHPTRVVYIVLAIDFDVTTTVGNPTINLHTSFGRDAAHAKEESEIPAEEWRRICANEEKIFHCNVKIEARLVNLAGETLWSLDVRSMPPGEDLASLALEDTPGSDSFDSRESPNLSHA